MYNAIINNLGDYPFRKLEKLLSNVKTPKNITETIMSIGEPKHHAPGLINEILNQNISNWNKYPPTSGTPSFRKTVTNWLEKRYNLPSNFINPDRNILPLAGTREGLFMVAQLVLPNTKVEKKPVVLIPNPFYQVYLSAAIMSEAKPVLVPANRENNFIPQFNELSEDTLRSTVLAYICNPSNPQGSVIPIESLKKIIYLAQKYNFLLVSDECYSEIYFNSAPPGIIQACAEMNVSLKNILAFNSLSKRSNSPGLRSGFVVGDDKLISLFQNLRSHCAAVQPLPIMAVAEALWQDEKHVEESRALYSQKLSDASSIIGNNFNYKKPDGGFFLWLNVKNSFEVTKKLWSEEAIKVLPGTFLCRPDKDGCNPGEEYIRVALVHDRETTSGAIKRIVRTLSH